MMLMKIRLMMGTVMKRMTMMIMTAQTNDIIDSKILQEGI